MYLHFSLQQIFFLFLSTNRLYTSYFCPISHNFRSFQSYRLLTMINPDPNDVLNLQDCIETQWVQIFSTPNFWQNVLDAWSIIPD
jgi:hypothetical protein